MNGSRQQSLSIARDLVLRHGWNANVYQILNPRIAHWISPSQDAVVGYVRKQHTVVVAGAPVCAEETLADVASQFEAWAQSNHDRVCYFGAEHRLRMVLERSSDHAAIAIGAQPVWNPGGWERIVQGRKSLRAQLNRARNKGVAVTTLPQAESARYDQAMRDCLDAWLASKPLPPMHFLVAPDTLDGVLDDRVILVARQQSSGEAGAVAAFLVASPVPRRNGFQIEQICRRHDAPNGTAELLIDAAMRELASRGAEFVTLGLVALAEHARSEIAENPLWIRVLMAWAWAHGKRFYNFSGLEAFRTKMEPDRWDTVYAIANEPRFSP